MAAWYFLNTNNDYDPLSAANYNSAADGSGSVPGSFAGGDILIIAGISGIGGGTITDPGQPVIVQVSGSGLLGAWPGTVSLRSMGGNTFAPSAGSFSCYTTRFSAATDGVAGTVNFGVVSVDDGIDLPNLSASASSVTLGYGAKMEPGLSVSGAIAGPPAPTYTAASNVRSGTNRGDGTSGTLVVPSAGDVRHGTSVDATVGTAFIPVRTDVRAGTAVDSTTGLLAVPAANKVLTGTAVDAGSGTLTIPTASQSLTSATFGIGGNSIAGNVTLPDASNVLATAPHYGVNSATAGTASTSGGGGSKLNVGGGVSF